MATVKLVSEQSDHPIVRGVFADIKATKKNRSRAQHLASPGHTARTSGALLDQAQSDHVSRQAGSPHQRDHRPGSLGDEQLQLLHQLPHGRGAKAGLDNQGLGELLAVVGLYNQMNTLANAYQVEPDILPEAR